MHKPSVKNSVLIAIAIAIIAAALVVSKYENRAYAGSAGINSQNSNSVQLPVISISGTSTDDQIQYTGNWQKTLSTSMQGVWGTSTSSASTSNQQLTPTEQFSRAIFSQYVAAQNNGQDMTDSNVQQAVATQVLTDGTVLPGPKIYTSKDIKTTTDNSSTSLQAYGYELGAIFSQDQGSGNQFETAIVQNSLNSNDPTILKQLDPYIASYQKIVNDLLAIKAPSNMASQHVALINAMNELLFADQSFEKIYTDALTGLAGTSAYKQGIVDFPNSLLAIKEYFVENKISFDTKSPAVIFNVKK